MGLRVAYLTHYADLYGANRSLLDLIQRLRKAHDVDPMVFMPSTGPLVQRLEALEIPFKIVPWAPWMTKRHYEGGWHHRFQQHVRHLRHARENRIRNKAMRNVLEGHLSSWNARLIHVNSLAVGIAGELAERSTIPVVWHMREMPEQHYGFHLDRGIRAYTKALQCADVRIAISTAVRNDVLRRIGSAAPIQVIHNGIFDHDGFKEAALNAEERWHRPVPFTFLMAGVIHPAKGQEDALEALATVVGQHPAVKLRIAGGGNAGALRERVKALGLEDHVELLGYVDDLTDFYRSGHALLMCSRHEALGRVSIEAMAHGMPVIGRAEGGTVEVVSDGVNGLLYGGGPLELSECMLQLIRDPERTERMGASAMSDVVKRFSVEESASEVMKCYNELVKQDGKQ